MIVRNRKFRKINHLDPLSIAITFTAATERQSFPKALDDASFTCWIESLEI